MATLPDSVKAMAEFAPVEDVLLPILRARIPEVPIQSLYKDDQDFPVVLVRRVNPIQGWPGDPRFIDIAIIDIECLCEGIEADTDGALLGEAVRVALRDAWREQDVIEGKGGVIFTKQIIPPHKVPDWATSVGPVQYADLPQGVARYESSYRVDIRKPKQRPYPL
jgi:hypothetical protein